MVRPGVFLSSAYTLTHEGWYHHAECDVHDGATVFPGVVIGPGVVVSAGCVLHPNAVIGFPGFGFYREPKSNLLKRRNHGHGVLLMEDAEIGACATVDAGRWRKTVIGSGSMIDNHVHMAHNVVTGRNVLVCASAIICGSVTLGDDVVVSPGANIRDGVSIGDRSHVALGALVLGDVPPDTTVVGVPARPIVPKHPFQLPTEDL